jgi:LuxR family transcriptional regulator, transcriptional regulator of spore coat protein
LPVDKLGSVLSRGGNSGDFCMSDIETAFGLTARERQIVALIARGRSAKEIAIRLSIAPRTVETYVEQARWKTGTRNSAHMIKFALKHHLIESSEGADPSAA